MEKWKDVVGYEGLYEVSNKGRIKTTRRKGTQGGFKKFTTNQDGYYRVKLCKDGKGRRTMVHRVVYEAFVGEIPKGLEINHIDENKTNNCVENLEAVTHLENVRHGTGIERMKAGLCKAVLQFTPDGKLVERHNSIKEAFEKTGVHRCNISWCCNGNIKTAVGYIWRKATQRS